VTSNSFEVGVFLSKGKGKGRPGRGLEDPEGKQRYSSYSYFYRFLNFFQHFKTVLLPDAVWPPKRRAETIVVLRGLLPLKQILH
jgi:hypothetical protein